MDTTLNRGDIARPRFTRSPARWAWWGAAAGALGLFANLAASHGPLTDATAAVAVADIDRGAQHIGAVAGMASFLCLLLAAGGWRRWAASGGLAAQTLAPALTASAAIVLLATGLRGGLAEYLPGGINEDNFADEGLYVLFMIHDTAPWFAWWGVVIAAGLLAWLSFTRRVVPLWLGVFSAVAVVPPVLIMALTGAVAIAGLIGPIWLAAASVVVAVRGLPAPLGSAEAPSIS
ncbi:MAG: hypothetical protein ACRDP9_21730 [Kribbellaceae bacterium]